VITDTGRSFISEGRKSHIFAQSKPVSVNVKPRLTSHEPINNQNTQSAIHVSSGIGFTSKKPAPQKTTT
jgi:hypothetical protein